ncbi:expressed unknown protein [Seminavis robusta]|uniref:Uncharacterized protein n=1 Tax=Seminavis robusta TaxID=568900 RepID=A0A9N8HQF0_9STRA|nr:expressed unknown protein [Seminavis robusta]|eukprot:Sro1436_g272430.1 n/a (312) ;mRNA; r:12092-13027
MAVVETVCPVDQNDAALQAVAKENGVDEGICGYVSTLLAFHLSHQRCPTSRRDLDDFLALIPKEIITPDTLRQSIQAVKKRRRDYVEQHPQEFAAEGEDTWDGMAQQQRVSPDYYLRSPLGVVDVAWILSQQQQQSIDKRDDNSNNHGIPLVISIPTSPHFGSYGDSLEDVLKALPFSEDRNWISRAASIADTTCQSTMDDRGASCCLLVQYPGSSSNTTKRLLDASDASQMNFRDYEMCCPAVLYYGDHVVCVVPVLIPSGEIQAGQQQLQETLLVLESLVPTEEEKEGSNFQQQPLRWQPQVYAKALFS